MKCWSCDSPSPDSTRALGAALARVVGPEGLAIALIGPLGAGKTVFVKGLAEGLGLAAEQVSSPTFVIVQEYRAVTDDGAHPDRLHHADLYRLEDESELESLGFFDLFERGALLAVEWADRFPGVLGPESLEIRFSAASSADSDSRAAIPVALPRRLEVVAVGDRAEGVLADWAVHAEREAHARADDAAAAERASASRSGSTLALCLAASGLLAAPAPPEACAHPQPLEHDALGTLHVVCSDAGTAAPGPSGVGGLLFGRRLDLNRVTQAQLEALPDIGPSRARAIVETRSARPMASVADLERVPGLGPKRTRKLERWLRVEALQSDPQPDRRSEADPDKAERNAP